MKIDVRMTPDELQNVVDAVAEAGDQRNYYVDDTILMELLEIVDAALTSMGINIVEDEDDDDEPNEMEFDCEGDCANCENPCPEEEEDEEEEEESIEDRLFTLDDGRTAISAEDANKIMDEMCLYCINVHGFPVEVAVEIAKDAFIQLSEDYGIDVVVGEEEEEEEEEEDEDEETSTDTTQYTITPKGEFVLNLMESGVPFELATIIADSIFKE